MSQQDALFFLNHQSYGTYSRELAKTLKSLNAAVFLAELIEIRHYNMMRNELISNEKHGDGWIYRTIDAIEERTALSRYEQETCIKILLKFDLIETVNFGLPCKRYFRLKDDKILELFGLSKKLYRKGETNKLDSGKSTNRSAENQQTALYTKEPNVVVVVGGAPPLVSSSNCGKLSKDEIYSRSLNMKKDWSATEIEVAYQKYVNYKQVISDHMALLDGIIKNIRTNNQSKEDKKCKTTKKSQIKTMMSRKNNNDTQEKTKKKNENNLKNPSETSNLECSDQDTLETPLARFERLKMCNLKY